LDASHRSGLRCQHSFETFVPQLADWILVRFNLLSIPAGSTINSATLYLTTLVNQPPLDSAAPQSAYQHWPHWDTARWSEDTVNWNTRPATAKNGGESWVLLAMSLTATMYEVPATQLTSGQYLLRVTASDGVNAGSDVSDGAFAIESALYLPWIRK
jgi:hypothetical protein